MEKVSTFVVNMVNMLCYFSYDDKLCFKEKKMIYVFGIYLNALRKTRKFILK